MRPKITFLFYSISYLENTKAGQDETTPTENEIQLEKILCWTLRMRFLKADIEFNVQIANADNPSKNYHTKMSSSE